MAYPFQPAIASQNDGQILFPFVPNTLVSLEFDGDLLSSDGGALLLREMEAQVGIVQKLATAFKDRRDPRYTDHSQFDLLWQRVMLIASGYEDANDSDADRLRRDAAFKMGLGRHPEKDGDLASQPTISRLENTPTRTDLYRLAKAFVDHFIAAYPTPPKWLIFDFDDTEDKTFGQQELAIFNGYYNDKCYLPLHIYEATSGRLVTAILKPGQRATGKQMLAIVRRLFSYLRRVWPNTAFVFRGDSHFAYPEVMDWLEAQTHMYYIIGLTGFPTLKARMQETAQQAKELYQSHKTPLCLYQETMFKAETWSHERRVYGKLAMDADGLRQFFRVTNIPHMRPSVLEEKAYTPRACAELRIKEHKCDLKSDRTSCHRFQANQFRLFLHSAAYVLMHALTTQLLKTTTWATATIATVRACLLKIAVRIQILKTRIKVTFPKTHPHLDTIKRGFQILSHLRLASTA